MRGAGRASREETAMSKQAIVKLCMGPGGKQSRRSAILGGKVIADYVSTDDSQRYVVIERSVPAKPAAKPKKQTSREKAADILDAAVSHA